MSRPEVLAWLALFAGAALLLSCLGPFRRLPRHRRASPYVTRDAVERIRPGHLAHATHGPAPDLSRVPSALSAVVGPLAVSAGDRLARMTGIRSGVEERLSAAGRPGSATDFRLRQFTIFLATLGIGVLVSLLTSPAAPLLVALLVAAPVLAALVPEHRLEAAIEARRRRLDAELPVIAEQLATMFDAGMSLGTGLDRIADRGTGIAAEEIAAVQVRVRRGRDQFEALRSWSDRSRSSAVERFVAALAMHAEAADVGSLLGSEARAMRESAHRQLVESIERRAQAVWIPVTVATLVPGLVLIAIPFVDAMTRISG
ncbi:MAG: type II secretion system F family protein [Microthrixaceae bacterium]